MEFSTENSDLIIVLTVLNSSVDFTVREGFEAFIMQPLSQRGELTSELDNFLSDDTTPEGSEGGNLSSSEVGNVSDGIFFDFFNLEDTFFINILSLSVDFLDNSEQLFSIFLRVEGREVTSLLDKSQKTSEGQMELFGSTEFFPIANI